MKLLYIGYNRGQNEHFTLKRKPRLVEYVMLVMRSRTFFVIENDTIYAHEGAVIIFDKNTAQHFGAHDDPFLHDWVTFDLTEDERDKLVASGVVFDKLLYPDNAFALSELIRTMHNEKYSFGSSDEKITSLYLEILLTKLALGIANATRLNRKYYSDLRRIRADIYSNPTQRYTVSELARSLNLSTSYFLHLYKEQFGTSPVSDIVKTRMEYAEYLLAFTNQSVKQIADELGYSSDIQFIQQFRKFTGQPPGKYRNTLC